MRKPTFWFPTWSDTNQAVQLQNMARGLKFRSKKEEGSFYLCRENKGADQLRGYRESDLVLISFAVTANLICVFVSHMQNAFFFVTRLNYFVQDKKCVAELFTHIILSRNYQARKQQLQN